MFELGIGGDGRVNRENGLTGKENVTLWIGGENAFKVAV
jgi:hypothetical protein